MHMNERHVKEPLVTLVRIADLKTTLYVRRSLDADRVLQFREWYEAGVQISPIKVIASSMEILDGRQRVEALKELGIETVQAYMVEGGASRVDDLITAYHENNGGPLPSTRDDTLFFVEQLVQAGLGEKAIVQRTGLHKSNVRTLVNVVKSTIRKQKVQAALRDMGQNVNMSIADVAKKHDIDVADLQEQMAKKEKKLAGSNDVKGGWATHIRSERNYAHKMLNSVEASVKSGAWTEEEGHDIYDKVVDDLKSYLVSIQGKHTRWTARLVTTKKGAA